MTRVFLTLASLLLWVLHAYATCSGSGLTWSCTAGSTAGQINTAISSASNEAVITFATGAYSFQGVDTSPRNGISLLCATVGGCTNSGTGTAFQDTSTGVQKTNLLRFSGFDFTASTSTSPTFSFGWVGGDPWIDKLRIDHNTIRHTDGYGIATGFNESVNRVNGVIDHNLFTGATHFYPLIMLGAGDTDWVVGGLQGSGENIFVEDNTFDYDAGNFGGSGFDAWQGGRVVYRYNTVRNARMSTHGRCHNGPANFEAYGNTMVHDGGDGADGFRTIHHQGSGEIIIFNNSLSPNTAFITVQHYRSSTPNPEGCGSCDGTQGIDGNRAPTATYKGYPCDKQPGRLVDGTAKPMFFWQNRLAGSGALAPVGFDSAGGTSLLSTHIVANRDYFEAVSTQAQTSATSPFNGTTGMGFGTLANRPTTCTTGTESADAGKAGVGYFATDVGSQGTLYMCTATNTWTVHYTPYTYPHPLTVTGLAFLSEPSGLGLSGNATVTFGAEPTGLGLVGNSTVTLLSESTGLGLSGNATVTFLGNPSGLSLVSP